MRPHPFNKCSINTMQRSSDGHGSQSRKQGTPFFHITIPGCAYKMGRSQARCSISQPCAWVKHQTWLLRLNELANQRLCGDESPLLVHICLASASKSKGHSHSGYLARQKFFAYTVPRRKQHDTKKKQSLLQQSQQRKFIESTSNQKLKSLKIIQLYRTGKQSVSLHHLRHTSEKP